ncbi:c2h2 type zinc finger domain containing protein [Grosmannia clavigera kw1407]|uniref:C2h2 type zinc finger domain containing protein n=1 Tax=Grosmannia clavigera (strain kw1407 / UAMH 11150) TaxID=655863 RepID=F0XI62_GROCL|nr:c2h2 type zinc finger domain containing protein [Grosmannia clavigera kw1407]EFX02839.1 c2h2 type zinc finger domain containing protein [Grosmannia clavigera kw1407]
MHKKAVTRATSGPGPLHPTFALPTTEIAGPLLWHMKRSRSPEEHLPSSSSPVSADEEQGQQPSTEADVELPSAKIATLDDGHADAAAEPAMICLLHRESVDFSSYGAYESHYNREHLNRCLECHRNFPSPFYLGLHTDEWHDPFVAVRRDKGEHTYACFVEGCERKCGSADKRRRHLIDKHHFPKNFFYAITQHGVDGRQSLLDDGRWRQQQQQHHHRRRENSESDSDRQSDVEMDDLTGALSAMTFAPRGVRFGRGGRVGFARRS